MSRLLVFGHSPLPYESSRIQCSGNLRTWHLVKPLLDAGHDIRLVGSRVPGSCPEEMPREVETREERLHYFCVAMDRYHETEYLQRHHDDFVPDAVISINNYPSSRAVTIDTDRPFWCDLNGWAMAEAQTKAATYDDDDYLSHFWQMEARILDRADMVSAVSRAQVHATVGELAQRGRLSRRTVGHPFCHYIPNALSEIEYPRSPPTVRGPVTPEDAFIVLWVGGYNTWTDIDLLYESLSIAMDSLDDLHFVSTGGALEGHDDITFAEFKQRIDVSPFKDRVHFVGWVPTSEVPGYYFESDLGLNVDRMSYETSYGARNRINDMLKVGLPILTTLGTEISQALSQRDLVLSADMGDPKAFADHILWACGHRDELQAMGRRASEFGHRRYSYEKTVEPLLTWAESPIRAPDYGERVLFDTTIDFFRDDDDREEAPDDELMVIRAEYTRLQDRYRQLKIQMERMAGSKIWRLYMLYIRMRHLLARRPGVQEASVVQRGE